MDRELRTQMRQRLAELAREKMHINDSLTRSMAGARRSAASIKERRERLAELDLLERECMAQLTAAEHREPASSDC